jgi:hypothetical protein
VTRRRANAWRESIGLPRIEEERGGERRREEESDEEGGRGSHRGHRGSTEVTERAGE